jgi:hypothetical protein
MGYLFIVFLGVIGFVVLIIWLIKTTWNDRGIRGELEEANLLKRLELQQRSMKNSFKDIVISGQEAKRREFEKLDKEEIERMEKIDQEHLEKIKDVELREKLRKIKEEQIKKIKEINKKRNEEFENIYKETLNQIE